MKNSESVKENAKAFLGIMFAGPLSFALMVVVLFAISRFGLLAAAPILVIIAVVCYRLRHQLFCNNKETPVMTQILRSDAFKQASVKNKP